MRFNVIAFLEHEVGQVRYIILLGHAFGLAASVFD